jgi:hypothetical protein
VIKAAFARQEPEELQTTDGDSLSRLLSLIPANDADLFYIHCFSNDQRADLPNFVRYLTFRFQARKVFVQNRVAKIQRSTEKSQCGHVSTNNNPTDMPTRDISIEELRNKNIWTSGPSYLQERQYIFKNFDACDLDPEDVCLDEFKTEAYLAVPF